MTTKGPLLITGATTDQSYRAPEDQNVLDLNYRHFTHRRGQFEIIGTWLFLAGRRDPCLVILRHGRPMRKQTPCIVPAATAWQWAEPPIGDENFAYAMACDFVYHLDLNPDCDADVIAIVSAVRSRLEDLIRIPPAPPTKRVLAGEVRFRTTAGVDIEKEVWDNA